jgi:hypothetical protein
MYKAHQDDSHRGRSMLASFRYQVTDNRIGQLIAKRLFCGYAVGALSSFFLPVNMHMLNLFMTIVSLRTNSTELGNTPKSPYRS